MPDSALRKKGLVGRCLAALARSLRRPQYQESGAWHAFVGDIEVHVSAEWPRSLPEAHARFLRRATEVFARDPRLAGVAAGGSFASDTMDVFSDLDLVVAADPSAYLEVLGDRQRIAESLGSLLVAFTGEHVSEPRLLICLYGDEPPLHVDLKFVSLDDVATRVEDPVVLWERDALFTRAMGRGVAQYPAPDRQWLEDRFWVWVHYMAAKIGRGELLEAHGCLGFVRTTVLGPLVLMKAGARPNGVRNVERLAASDADLVRATVAGLSRSECVNALRAAVAAYQALRTEDPSWVRQERAELAALAYLERLDTAG